jgi:HEAT repeat protein
MSMEKFLEYLLDSSTEVPMSDFVEVSDLSPSELGIFAREWLKIPVERQRWTVSTMVELAEDNPELDFCAVFKMCLRDKDEMVLEKAMEGLWETEDRSVIPSLIQVLRSNRSPSVRASAAVALGKFASLVQDGKLLQKDAHMLRENLIAVLENTEEPLEVRRRSLEAVAPFNTEDIKKYVCWAYDSDDLSLKSSSIYAMGRTGETSWLPLLRKELQNNEASVRYESANACAELGDEDTVPLLISLLQDDDYQVQLAGLSALGKIGGPLAKRALLRCVKEGDAVLEEAARSALEGIEFLEDPMAFSSDL